MNKQAEVYEFDAALQPPLLENHLELGGDNGVEKIEVTNRYLLRNGKPWIPFMGEYQFSRAKENEWKKELCKMKAGGINTVATYIIWIHHEETEGEISFEGNLNLRKFAETCYACGLHLVLRIGPWVHGEAKNGGFPDWLQHKPNLKLRTNDPEYLKYCRRWYTALAQHLKGFMFQDGKPLLAIQIENELYDNEEHLTALLEMAKVAGFDAPIYTATGWGSGYGASLPAKKLLPMFGGYPAAPWEQHTRSLGPIKHYFFSPIRNDGNIGSDLRACSPETDENGQSPYHLYPFATCELGGGNQVTYHRRPQISEKDITAMTLVKLGSGANLFGYYMYHGGRNPLGAATTMNESRESGYPNDVPYIDYDFQAQLGAWGAVREHYRACRIFALFLEDFGQSFAKTVPYFQKDNPTSIYDDKSLRYSARSDGKSGYVFINNYSRKQALSDHNGVKFNIDGEIFPHGELNVKNEEFGFLPYHMALKDVILKYAMLQPICKHGNAFFFFAPFGGCDEFCFKRDTVSKIEVDGDIIYTDREIIVSNISGKIVLTSFSGKKIVIEILTPFEAKHLCRLSGKLYLSDCDMLEDGNSVYVYGTDAEKLNCKLYAEGGFVNCSPENVTSVEDEISVKEIDAFDSKYIKQFELSNGAKLKYYEIALPENREHLILSMDIVADIAELYADGRLVADCFLNGRTWYVGPDEFLNCKKLSIVLSELSPEKIYLETDKNSGLKINRIAAMRLYEAHICET